MKKIYIGVLLVCFWVQKNTTARRGKGWWYWSARLGAWAAGKVRMIDARSQA